MWILRMHEVSGEALKSYARKRQPRVAQILFPTRSHMVPGPCQTSATTSRADFHCRRHAHMMPIVQGPGVGLYTAAAIGLWHQGTGCIASKTETEGMSIWEEFQSFPQAVNYSLLPVAS